MYRAPVSDIAFTLKHVAGLSEAIVGGRFPDLTEDVVDAVLAEAGRFASEELAPLNRVGDREGVRLADGVVTTAPGWRQRLRGLVRRRLERHRRAGGFAGGQGLPLALSAATQEIWNAACMSFALCPLLDERRGRGGDQARQRRAEVALPAAPHLRQMDRDDEPDGAAGGLRPRRAEGAAEPRGDGTYRLFGQKIFITYGEHDLAENIVHLVLARLPDAPPGSSGISLFLVPKFLVNGEGTMARETMSSARGLKRSSASTARRPARCSTATAVRRCAGRNRLARRRGASRAPMHVHDDERRPALGRHPGRRQAELALQQATAYAQERRQGRAPGRSGDEMSPIVEHPDVQRMLMTMRALTEASRASATPARLPAISAIRRASIF